MIGVPPINRIPGGLLGFLGIKNGGRNPDALSNVLVPQLDLTEVYLRTNYVLARIDTTVAAVGFTGAGTVPAGQAWYVSNVFANTPAALGAGQVLRGCPAAALPDGVAFSVCPLADPRETLTNYVYECGPPARPYQLLPPGTAIGFYCHGLAAGPFTVTVQLWYAVFDV